jgi:hypothetical protein
MPVERQICALRVIQTGECALKLQCTARPFAELGTCEYMAVVGETDKPSVKGASHPEALAIQIEPRVAIGAYHNHAPLNSSRSPTQISAFQRYYGASGTSTYMADITNL